MLASLLVLTSGCLEAKLEQDADTDRQGDATMAPGDAGDAGESREDAASVGADADALPVEVGDGDASVITGADAGSRDDAGSGNDAGPTEKARLAEAMAGLYAVRTHYFAQDDRGKSRGREITLVSISALGEQAEMSSTICSWISSSISIIGEFSIEIEKPERLPIRVQTLSFENGLFTSSGPAVRAGYTRAVPDVCLGKGGVRVPHRDLQPYLTSGECVCPASSESTPSTSDCRVFDSDGDDLAGLSARAYGPATGRFQLVSNSEIRYVNGVVDAEGDHAARESRIERVDILSCSGSLPCDLGTAVVCQSRFNRVQFERLDPRPQGAPWTCAAVMSAYDSHAILDYPDPEYPSENCLLVTP